MALGEDLERLVRRGEIRGEAALVADGRAEVALVQHLLEVVEHLGPHAQGLAEGLGALGDDHELLEVDGVVGVLAAVDDVHQRHGQVAGVGAAEVAVERQADGVGGGLGDGERDAEGGVRAELGLVGGAVEFDQQAVDGDLVERVHAEQFGRDRRR